MSIRSPFRIPVRVVNWNALAREAIQVKWNNITLHVLGGVKQDYFVGQGADSQSGYFLAALCVDKVCRPTRFKVTAIHRYLMDCHDIQFDPRTDEMTAIVNIPEGKVIECPAGDAAWINSCVEIVRQNASGAVRERLALLTGEKSVFGLDKAVFGSFRKMHRLYWERAHIETVRAWMPIPNAEFPPNISRVNLPSPISESLPMYP
jgi:hypothetical protein